jgi:hypothetical protein
MLADFAIQIKHLCRKLKFEEKTIVGKLAFIAEIKTVVKMKHKNSSYYTHLHVFLLLFQLNFEKVLTCLKSTLPIFKFFIKTFKVKQISQYSLMKKGGLVNQAINKG